MEKKIRIPRKLKKELKKEGLYTFGLSDIHCIDCQKRYNGYGYDLHFCKKCWDN
jgi:rRNA maturation endonuclease Nob1